MSPRVTRRASAVPCYHLTGRDGLAKQHFGHALSGEMWRREAVPSDPRLRDELVRYREL